MSTIPIEVIIAECSFARAATPGEQCQCGHPAVIVYEPDGCTPTPSCGVNEGAETEVTTR